ncbi:LuxR C-terminal-related transcriptional regulator [uncultured Bacteroides sp.]|uniref:helix-turn-helix transcriptional regulator n=1 Tax=uncultured Bacteroides sp. TaxID=162156 RepID=UPI0025E23D19|nr:LuxR C-terminal-related transcriptional regulator [uncultured Bacteroides sp.]
MKTTHATREEMWAKQCLSSTDIDYTVWERDKSILHRLSKINYSCTFVVDVYKCSYTYASRNFVDLLGYDSHKIETLERQGDYLESRIHPDDRAQLATLQITLAQFIYNLPLEQRNDYSNIYSFRMLNARQQYIRVTSRHQVLEQDRNGKAWLIIGNIDISPNQRDFETVDCTVLNLKNGKIFSPSLLPLPSINLTNREIEILRLIQKGLLSKEIADKLCISIHTVNIHRQNLLRKLGVQNSIEAIRLGQEIGLLS